ncbi:MAG: ParB N-terminal domain-containing protein [Microgenomates group bacterium]
MGIKFIDISKLKAHEKVSKMRVKKLLKQIVKEKILKRPIIVDSDNYIILDGHHRTEVFKSLNFKKIPALLVDYKRIKVVARRKKYAKLDIRNLVISMVKKNKLLPYKTTKHLIPFKNLLNVSFDLNYETNKKKG